jgi:hypothetical protein
LSINKCLRVRIPGAASLRVVIGCTVSVIIFFTGYAVSAVEPFSQIYELAPFGTERPERIVLYKPRIPSANRAGYGKSGAHRPVTVPVFAGS